LAGSSLRQVSRQVALSKDSIARHRPHVESALVEARTASEARLADALSSRLDELSSRARRLADAAEASGNTRESLLALREMSRLIEIEAKIAGRIDGTKVDINLRTVNIDTLSDVDLEAFVKRAGDRVARIWQRELKNLLSDVDIDREIEMRISRYVGRPVTMDEVANALKALPDPDDSTLKDADSPIETTAALVPQPAAPVQEQPATPAVSARCTPAPRLSTARPDVRLRALARLDDHRR
jgi:hypothetical protein